jgi:SAM-dependent methyltransferase
MADTAEDAFDGRPNTDRSSGAPGQFHSAYAEFFNSGQVANYYEECIYASEGYDAFQWQLQRWWLTRIMAALAQHKPGLKYLDFACGTGRIIAALETFAGVAIGLDTSAQMLNVARPKLTRAELRCGDILAEPDIVDWDFDVITVFRFLIPTEPWMREAVMHSLASRLRGTEGLLIVDIHRNRWSTIQLDSLIQRVTRQRRKQTMSYWVARALIQRAGLEIVAWHGFGLCPEFLHHGATRSLARTIDRYAVRLRPLRWVSRDLVFVCRRAS